jgi:hypothetical protein
MSTTRLHNLALISIERELSFELIQDPTKIVNEFAKLKIEDFNSLNNYYILYFYVIIIKKTIVSFPFIWVLFSFIKN